MRFVPRVRLAALASSAAVALVALVACARGPLAGFISPDDDTPLFIGNCDGGGTCPQSACMTTVSGTALAPNAVDPLYGALVYVPSAPLAPVEQGATCARCDVVSGEPVASATSTPEGHFSLEVPRAEGVELVVQVGKWRRKVSLPPLVPCADNPLPAELTRLPRAQWEGNIPLHAVTLGNCDRLECVLRQIGVDDGEFTVPSGGGRVHLYRENGATVPDVPAADDLTNSPEALKRYDLVLFDCAGEAKEKTAQQKQNVVDFTSAGGRIFVSHFSYVWLYNVPPFSTTADWNINAAIPEQESIIAKLDTSFARGAAFAKWLTRVGAISREGDNTVEVLDPRFDVNFTVPPGERLIYTESPRSVQELTFDTPIGAAPRDQCGRVAFTDFHVTGASCTPDGMLFPLECEAAKARMTPQERVMEFMLFDLASCLQGNGEAPPPLIR